MSSSHKNEQTGKFDSSKVSYNICNRKISKLTSSIIVPLLIGLATVLISVVQLQIANKQRAQDLHIATERREQDLYVADNLQQDLVLAAYIEQMSALMLTSNFTVNDTIVANIFRAKTLIAVRQLNPKRKTHLIKFLLAASMIRHNEPHMHLADAELDNIDLSVANYIESRYLRALSDFSFKHTSLNNASFSYRTIVNGNFDEASLLGANFIGCRFSSTSFVGAILQYADFRNASSKEYVDFKSADLFGSNISDEILLSAISIEDAILPNGTRGIQRNLLVDGDAEVPNCHHSPSVPASWQVEHISGNLSLSVDSYLSNMNVIHLINSTVTNGQCFYAVRGGEGKLMMRQQISSASMAHMPIRQGNVFLVLKLLCAPVNRLREEQDFVELHVQQFDRSGISLHNYTKDIHKQGSYTKTARCHRQLHRIIVTLTFNRLSSPTKTTDADNTIFYYCDNIYLSMVLRR